MAIIDDLAATLTAAGYTKISARVFSDRIGYPQVCIIPGGGSSYIITGGDLEKPNVQIQVKDDSMTDAEVLIYAIKTLLHKNDGIAHTVTCIWDGREPDYWKDDNDLHVFAIEFKLIRVS